MIWFAFGSGVALVMIAVVLFILGVKTLEVLGLGALGIADLIALFVYKPIDRHQRIVSAIKTFHDEKRCLNSD